MALSKIYTALKLWNEAAADIKFPDNDESYIQRFLLINRAVNVAMSKFFDLFSVYYMTTAAPSSGASMSGIIQTRYNHGYGYAYNHVDNSFLVNSSPNPFTAFTAVDVGKEIHFIDAGATPDRMYIGVIASIFAANIVYFDPTKGLLPSATINQPLVTTYWAIHYDPYSVAEGSSSAIDLTALTYQPYRAGMQGKMTLASSLTSTVRAVGHEEFRTWSPTAVQNKNTIVYTIEGDYINLKKGSNLSTYGSLSLKYPRLPIPVAADATYVDVPDGVAIDVALMVLKQILCSRLTAAGYPAPKYDFNAEIKALVEPLYATLGQEYEAEPDKDKLIALK
jgi:hypothetical protein